MDEELKEIQAQIESLYSYIENPNNSYSPEVAETMLKAYEEYEITIDSFLKVDEYVDFLVLHYITDNWGNTAKFMWKRIPDQMKKEKSLKAAWEIGQLLFKSNFIEAATKINVFSFGRLSAWLKSGYRFLMHKIINKMYSNIDDDTFRALMGLANAKEQKEYMDVYEVEVKPTGILIIFNKFTFKFRHFINST